MSAKTDLSDILVFAKVAETGSFRQAARALSMPVSSVSRKVAAVEAELGVRLLERTTRSLAVTELGRQYYQRCQRILASADEAVHSLREGEEVPKGKLRVTAPVPIGLPWVSEVVCELMRRHPDLEVELSLTDRIVDMIEEGFDVAVRVQRSWRGDPRLLSRPLGLTYLILVASPDYLKKHGEPRSVADLSRHTGIVYGAPSFERGDVLPESGVEVLSDMKTRLFVNDMPLALNAALAGAGIASVSAMIAAPHLSAKKIVQILPGWRAPSAPVLAVYPEKRASLPAISALLALLEARLSPALRSAAPPSQS